MRGCEEGGGGAYDGGTLPADGREEDTLLAFWLRGVDGEVGAAEGADLDGPVDDEGETDCILVAAEEALCAVDWVERPYPYPPPPTFISQ